MAFFPRQFYNDATSFTPLFRLLDDFDNYSRQSDGGARRSGLPHWQPKFDVRETAEAYELHGEIPGVNKNDVHIEFTEPQVMVVRGKSERVYTSGTPPAGNLENSSSQGAIADSDETKNSHKATVEDENVADQTQIQARDKTSEVVKQTEQKQPADKAKYWISERSVGEFARTFNFPTRVDQDAVTANFKDGILNISVPKAKKHESRRIAVN
ncbi:30 kDa heat shock protein [Paramyrothecium foliicola]|nr:30 kDa heat shock protein [Paramyrothecium foliicola]